MKRIYIIIIIICALVGNSTKAQTNNWTNPSSLNLAGTSVNAIYEDTVADLLYLGLGSYVRVFDGSNYGIMGTSFGSNGVRTIIKYNGDLYAGGVCLYREFTKWNGTDWDTTGFQTDGVVTSTFVFNGDLYVGGNFTQIGGVQAKGLAKYDGTNWSSVGNFPFSYSNGITGIGSYNGELIIGGIFGDTLWNEMNIARWDGSTWRSIGNGVQGGGITNVSDFAVYNNELYIGGSFLQANGNAGNNILKWDGISFSDVGGGLSGNISGGGNGQIYGLHIFDNKLFAVGAFRYAAGLFFACNIAAWDGSNWCGTFDTLNNGVLAVGEFRDTLYVGGAFSLINSSDTIVGLAKWIGGNFGDTCGNTTGTDELHEEVDFISVFPNPANSSTTLKFSAPFTKGEFSLINQFGQTVMNLEINSPDSQINLNGLANGLYYYRVEESGKIRGAGKLIITKY